MIKKINGDLCHDMLLENAERKLAFDENAEYDVWRENVRNKFIELLGINNIKKNSCSLNIDIEEECEKEGYKQIRFTFDSEHGATVPCYLLIPDTGKESYPVAIVIQGHTTGFHNSAGLAKTEEDKENYPSWCFGLQAVENGFAALCLEQRGMGERCSWQRYGEGRNYELGNHSCSVTALRAINLGRTVIGERVWDISKGIDALENFKDLGLDLEKILIMGHSGGGTATYYAACYDDRIKYSVPAGAFCSYKASVMAMQHCVCNYIPDICNWLEMEDLACLIAPRPLTIVTGGFDDIFPLEGVKKSFKTVREIYKVARADDKGKLVITPDVHHWNEEVGWKVIVEDVNKMGWL